MENKKVRNAKEVVYDNIKFKSTLEERAYKFLKNSNVSFQYEPKTFVLQEGFMPTIPFYEPNGKTVVRKYTKKGSDYKVKSMKYTPDFIVTFPNILGIIEMKGNPNDRYPMVEKLFRKYLESSNDFDRKVAFFRVKTITQLSNVLMLLKELNENEKL